MTDHFLPPSFASPPRLRRASSFYKDAIRRIPTPPALSLDLEGGAAFAASSPSSASPASPASPDGSKARRGVSPDPKSWDDWVRLLTLARWGNRAALKAVVDSHAFQRPYISLVLLDLLMVSAESQLGTLGVLSWLAALVHFLLQAALALEIAGLIAVYQLTFFFHPWFVLDAVLFVGTMLVEGFHHEEGAQAARFTLRVWRLVRVLHAVAVAVELEWHEASELATLRAEVAELRARNRELSARVVGLERRRAGGGGSGGGGSGGGSSSGGRSGRSGERGGGSITFRAGGGGDRRPP
jgi:hypothetical protein